MWSGGPPPDLLELFEIGVVVASVPDARLRRVNAAACRLLGRSEDELVGMLWQDAVPVADREPLQERIQRWLAGDRSNSRVVVRIVRPDGSTVYALVTAKVIYDSPDGEPYFFSQIQEVTNPHIADRDLNLVLDNTPVSMFLMGRDGRLLFSRGTPPGDVRDRLTAAEQSTIFEEFAYAPAFVDLLRKAAKGERIRWAVKNDGRYFDLHLVPILDPDGTVNAVASVATDITRQERALAQQAVVADLGQRALEALELGPLWQHAASELADQLDADSVTVHEVTAHEVTVHEPVAEAAELRLATSVGPRPLPNDLAATALTTRRQVSATDIGASATGRDDGQVGLAVPVGRPDHAAAVVTVYRQGRAPAGSTGRRKGAFSREEVAFVQSAATVLGYAAVRIEAERETRHQALHDGLTGLPNRTALLADLERALERADHDVGGLAVLFIDLDGFKAVNDSFGHRAGDNLLREVARRLVAVTRPGDRAARLSGDEFAMLCEGVRGEAEARRIAERVIGSVREPITIDSREVTVTASVGIAMSRPDCPERLTGEADVLLDAADIAMYTAKRDGPGRALMYQAAMRTRIFNRLSLTDDLRFAAGSDQLRLFFQPIRTLDGKLHGADAQLRWRHPTRGVLTAAEFLPLAAVAGLTGELEWWALETACRVAGTWAPDGPPSRELPRVVVSVSGRQLTAPGFVPDLDRLLRATGAGRRYELGLVFPDSAFLDVAEVPTQVLDALRSLPVVSYVTGFVCAAVPAIHRELPLDGVVLRGEYLLGLDADAARQALISGFVQFAHARGLVVLAAGVATPSQLAALRELGCDYAQGDVIGPAKLELPTVDGFGSGHLTASNTAGHNASSAS